MTKDYDAEPIPYRESRPAAHRTVALLAATALALSWCTGSPDKPPHPSPAASTAASESSPSATIACPTDKAFTPDIPKRAEYFYVNTSAAYYSGLKSMIDSPEYDPVDCTLSRLEETPVATWIGDWTGNPTEVARYVHGVTKAAQQQDAIPLFVGYNIPNRDIGQYSADGATEGNEYLARAKGISEGIGNMPAVLVWEPNALTEASQLPQADRQARLNLLHDSLQLFKRSNPQTYLYLDAGHDSWLSAEEAARLLRDVDRGDDLVTRIALNVSSHGRPQEVAEYGKRIAKEFGKPLDILEDTSRSGAVVPNRAQFCNNPHARIGKIVKSYFDPKNPVTQVFVKPPLESDGGCGSDQPEAGRQNPAYLSTLLGLPKPPYTAAN